MLDTITVPCSNTYCNNFFLNIHRTIHWHFLGNFSGSLVATVCLKQQELLSTNTSNCLPNCFSINYPNYNNSLQQKTLWNHNCKDFFKRWTLTFAVSKRMPVVRGLPNRNRFHCYQLTLINFLKFIQRERRWAHAFEKVHALNRLKPLHRRSFIWFLCVGSLHTMYATNLPYAFTGVKHASKTTLVHVCEFVPNNINIFLKNQSELLMEKLEDLLNSRPGASHLFTAFGQ